MGIQTQKSLRCKAFRLCRTKTFFILSVYYVGASEMTTHRGLESAEIVLAPGRCKNGFGARRNVGKGVCFV